MHFQKRSLSSPAMVAIPVVLGVVFISIAAFVWYRKRWPKSVLYVPKKPSSTTNSSQRQKQKPSRIKNFFRHGFKGPSPSSGLNDEETGYTPSTHSTTDARDPSITEMTVTNDAPNRNRGSIRSILTLPTYHPSPRADEQLIAREGERAGVDTVVEYPETQDEEEARREADMAALYEIRQVRRRELEERNERRAARAEARENRDWPRLEQLRLEGVARQQTRAQAERERTGSASGSSLTLLPTVSSSAMPEQGIGGNYNNSHHHSNSNNNSSQSLIAEHTARAASRDRRVSSVSYADLGLARHDGSRLRENSVDSDHRPLLEGAAIMGSGPAGQGGAGTSGSNDNSRRGSLFNTNTSIFRSNDGRLPLQQHHRATSAESVMTTESEYADARTTAIATTGTGTIMTPQTSSSSGQRSASESSPPAPMIGEDPPQYEDAPPYTSPVAGRGEGNTAMSLPLSLPTSLSMDMGVDMSTPTPAPRLDRANTNVVPAIQVSDSTSGPGIR